MTPKDFIVWFKGFASAAHTYNITPKQWEDILCQLEKVDLEQKNLLISIPIQPEGSVDTTYNKLINSISYTVN